jgi:Spy/CpxP family protein refolding chaperone
MNSTPYVGRCTILLALTLAVVAPASASSQAQPGKASKWWASEVYQRELGLMSDQSRLLEEIFQASVPGQRALKKSLDEAEALLERYVEQGEERAATEQITRVVAARANLQTSHAMMLLKMRLVLTKDQWIKLGALQKADDRARTQKPDTGK